jgi:hypothetical protein
MAEIRIRAGSATQSPSPEFFEAIRELEESLGQNYAATIQQVERIPGRYGVTWGESVAIFIGTSVASGLIEAMVNDVYNEAKAWGRDRLNKQQQENPDGRTRPLSITLYDAEDQRLLNWLINGDGEHEIDYTKQGDGSESGSPDN